MEKLPQEIIDNITSHFPWYDDDLKQILTVSRAFQNSVERRMCEHYHLTEDRADAFLRQYTAKRIPYLRYVQFVPTFPKAISDDHDDRERGCRENSSELLEKDEAFTRQIGVLFQALKCLEDRVGTESIRGKLHLTIFEPRRDHQSDYCSYLIYTCWRVHLLRPETLPQLSSVHTLEIEGGNDYFVSSQAYFDRDAQVSSLPASKLDLRVVMDLASRLSVSLKQINYHCPSHWDQAHSGWKSLRKYTKDWAGPHRDTRLDFAKSLESVKLPALKRMKLSFRPCYDRHRDQRKILPNFVLPRPFDPFSTSLRVLSYQLETMILRAPLDHTIFWPINGSADGDTPYWPNLKYLDVFFYPYSPSGEWYFQGPRGEGSDASPGYEITQADYEPLETKNTGYCGGRGEYWPQPRDILAQFRKEPIDKTLRPLLVAFTQAANRMPSLRKALLWTNLEWRPWGAYDYYEREDEEEDEGEDDDDDDDDDDDEEDEGNEEKEEKEKKEEKPKFGWSGWDLGWTAGWGVAYAKPGEHIDMVGKGHENCASRQFWWMTHDWRPDSTLQSMFDKIGQVQHGNEAIHHWSNAQGQTWIHPNLDDDGLIKFGERTPYKDAPGHIRF